MATTFVTIGSEQFELTISMRVTQSICKKFSKTPEQLMGALVEGSPSVMIDILKMGLTDKEQSKSLEDAILDGDCGLAHLRNITGSFLLELSYPGSDAEKEASIASTVGANEEQKNGMRAILGLPLMPVSEPQNFGNA